FGTTRSLLLRARRLLGLRRVFLKQRFPAQPDLSGWVDVDDLHEELFALLQLVAHILHAMRRDLGDVEEAVGAGQYLDERAEVGDALNLSKVGLVQLRR